MIKLLQNQIDSLDPDNILICYVLGSDDIFSETLSSFRERYIKEDAEKDISNFTNSELIDFWWEYNKGYVSGNSTEMFTIWEGKIQEFTFWSSY